jgi:hypothetical protein
MRTHLKNKSWHNCHVSMDSNCHRSTQTEVLQELLELKHIIILMSHFCLYSWASAHHKIMFRACTLHTQFLQNCKKTSNLNFSEEITPGTIMIISTSLHWRLQSEFQNHAEQMYLICLGHPTTRVRSFTRNPTVKTHVKQRCSKKLSGVK